MTYEKQAEEVAGDETEELERDRKREREREREREQKTNNKIQREGVGIVF